MTETFVYDKLLHMTRVRNKERDHEIATKKDTHGWTFRRIAKFYNLSVSSVFEAYDRAKKDTVRLSTG